MTYTHTSRKQVIYYPQMKNGEADILKCWNCGTDRFRFDKESPLDSYPTTIILAGFYCLKCKEPTTLLFRNPALPILPPISLLW